MEAVAKLKSCPMSARKMRLVIDNIRGKRVDDALGILQFSKQEAAVWLRKVLMSAIANWEQKTGGVESAADYDLFVKTAFSDGGTMLKRLRPAPHGTAHRIRKRTNHITLIVANKIPIAADKKEVVEVEEVKG